MTVLPSDTRTSAMAEQVPTVSVIIPTSNSMSGGKLVERTIRSVLSESIDAEVVVVDNFSRDSTIAVCRQLGVRVLQRASTRSEARNLGLEEATGEFVFFLDSDHEVEPGALAEAIRLAKKSNFDAVFLKTTFLQVDSKNRVETSPLELELCLRQGIRFPNLFRRSSISGRRFHPELDLGEDYVFMQELIADSAKIGSMDWGLRHYSPAALEHVWARSVRYGQAYRCKHDVLRQARFSTYFGVWNLEGVREYCVMLRISPRAAMILARFLLIKYLGFAWGLLVPKGGPAREIWD